MGQPEDITDEEIAHLKSLLAASTPGKWKRCGCRACGLMGSDDDGIGPVRIVPGDGIDDLPASKWGAREQADIDVFVAARNVLPRLIAEIERLRPTKT